MAAQVASQSSDGSQNKDSASGVSYASAVLNFKSMDNNKENINAATVGTMPKDSVTKEQPIKSKTVNNPQQKVGRQPTYATASKPISNTEDFPQITSNIKSARRTSQSNKVDRDHNNKHKTSQSAAVSDSVANSENTTKPSPDTPEAEVDSAETTEEVPEKKKFVEAPLPKTNPWTKNKNAASVIGKSTEQQLPSTAPSPAVQEKRVLQPQQQGTVENGPQSQPQHQPQPPSSSPSQPTIVRAPKDRRRFNQKASDFTDTDWPTLGTTPHVTEKKAVTSVVTVEDGEKDRERERDREKEKEVRQVTLTITTAPARQNGHTDSHDAHDTENADKRKKTAKAKWLPLVVDLAKGRGKRDRSPKHARDRNGDHNEGQDGEPAVNGNYRDYSGRGRAGPRHGRGARGARGAGLRGGRGYGRGRHMDTDYPDYPTEYTQVALNKFGNPDGFMMPFMGTFYFDSTNYRNLDDPTLMEYIRKQIEYYFSKENLMKDLFLRRKMDTEGYLPVTLIASFHRVRALTMDINKVLQAIQASKELQLTADNFKVRTVHDPTKWPIPDTVGNPLVVHPQHPLSIHPLGPPMLQLAPLTPLPPPIHPTHAFPPHPVVPPPPLPYTAGPVTDNLNPNVPEFVPVIQPMVNGTTEDSEPVDECVEACEELEAQTETLTINERIPTKPEQEQQQQPTDRATGVKDTEG